MNTLIKVEGNMVYRVLAHLTQQKEYVIWICPECGDPDNVPTDREARNRKITQKELEVSCEYCRIDGKLELEV